jgi:hypothetical protein
VVSIVCIIVLYIVYFLIIYMNVKKEKWLGVRWITYTILIVKIVFCIGVLGYAAFAIMVANVINYSCYAMGKLLTDKEYNRYLNPNSKEVMNVITACLGPEPTGSLITANEAEFLPNNAKLTALTGTSSLFNQNKAGIMSTPPTWFGKTVKERIEARKNLRESDSSAAGDNGIDATITRFNSAVSCVNDEFMYFGKCTKQVSQPSDTATAFLNSGYCMQATTTSSSKYQNRYLTTSCVTDSSVKGGLAGNIINSISDYQTKSQALYDEYMKTFTHQEALINKLKSVENDLQTLSNGFLRVNSILDVTGGDMEKALTCTLFREHTLLSMNVFCIFLGHYYMIHTMIIVNLSIIFFFYTLFLFCGIRVGDIEREKHTPKDSAALVYRVDDLDIETDKEKLKPAPGKEKDEEGRKERIQTPGIGAALDRIIMPVTD